MRKKVGELIEKSGGKLPDKLISLLLPSYSVKKRASQLLQAISKNEVAFNHEIAIESYTGNNKVVKQISDYLESRSHPAITGALIHGSIATGEEVSYSDFDGILLINEKRIENAYSAESLIAIINKTAGMMYNQDALQHHGWNILTMEDLSDYPDAELPFVLIEHSKVIYPVRKITVQYNLETSVQNYQAGLKSVCESLRRKAESQSPATSFRDFKAYVSQILLLPALYLQAKHNRPVFKKESFTRIGELPVKAQSVINKYSRLRSEWNQQEARPKTEIASQKMIVPSLIRKMATPLPSRYHGFVSAEAFTEVNTLPDILYFKG